MSEWFRRFARETGIAEPKALDFELCLNEIVTNIILYGYDAPGEREIHITLERDRGDLRATIEDDGRPFDPLGAKPPGQPATLEDATLGGWGIPIVRALVDDWRYERRDGRNRLTIVSRAPEAERSGL